ncbi:MAG: hypothetical protein IH621_02390 [Krumholzibacteria bacterium]|nr:hypothetical protein [Candidatus Krumholzibacteria bacterium]
MRSLFVSVALTGVLFLFAGCSEDDPCSCRPLQEQPLAEIVRSFAGDGYLPSVRIACFYLAEPDTIFLYDRWIHTADSGLKLAIDAGNCPAFDEVAGRLTDGIEEMICMGVWDPSGGGFIEGSGESVMLRGFSDDPVPDLAGAKVTKAFLHIDMFHSYDGQGARFELLYRTVFVGLP